MMPLSEELTKGFLQWFIPLACVNIFAVVVWLLKGFFWESPMFLPAELLEAMGRALEANDSSREYPMYDWVWTTAGLQTRTLEDIFGFLKESNTDYMILQGILYNYVFVRYLKESERYQTYVTNISLFDLKAKDFNRARKTLLFLENGWAGVTYGRLVYESPTKRQAFLNRLEKYRKHYQLVLSLVSWFGKWKFLILDFCYYCNIIEDFEFTSSEAQICYISDVFYHKHAEYRLRRILFLNIINLKHLNAQLCCRTTNELKGFIRIFHDFNKQNLSFHPDGILRVVNSSVDPSLREKICTQEVLLLKDFLAFLHEVSFIYECKFNVFVEATKSWYSIGSTGERIFDIMVSETGILRNVGSKAKIGSGNSSKKLSGYKYYLNYLFAYESIQNHELVDIMVS